jgi:phenylalanine-4-hydroxylase
VLDTPVKVDEFQKVLFAIDSFDQMYEAMHEAEQRVLQNSL